VHNLAGIPSIRHQRPYGRQNTSHLVRVVVGRSAPTPAGLVYDVE
jgi:hypothetical protein